MQTWNDLQTGLLQVKQQHVAANTTMQAVYPTNSNTASNQLRGNVVNSNGEPVPFARVDLNRDSRRVSTINGDANGEFVYYSADTCFELQILLARWLFCAGMPPSVQTPRTPLFCKGQLTVAPLAEDVVVTSIGQKRKQPTARPKPHWASPLAASNPLRIM
jgi:hypothetical protein